MHKPTVRITLLAILLLALALRCAALTRQDIWGDEAFSIWLSSRPLTDIIAGGADTHPPGYPLLLALWIRLLGDGVFAVRGLSALTGWLIVPAIYVLGRRALDRATGLTAALLAASAPVLVYYAQETRMYSLVTLLTALSFYWTLRLRDRPTPRAGLAYALCTLGAMYTHYYAFFVIAAENLIALRSLLRRGERRARRAASWLGVQCALALAYLPWIAVQRSFLSGKAGARVAEWDLATAGRIAAETVTGFSAGLAVTAPVTRALTLPFVTVVALGLLAVLRRPARAGTIVAYFGVPLALAWAINPIMPFFFPRYLLLIAPAFYLLAAAGLGLLARLWRPLALAGLLALLVGNATGLRGTYTDPRFDKGRYGQLMDYIAAHSRPGDGLLLANPLQIRIFEYYRPAGIEAYLLPRLTRALDGPDPEYDLAAVAEEHPRLWLVRYGNPAEFDPGDVLNGWLATHGSKSHFSTWKDADLALYVMQTATDAAPQHPLDVRLGADIRLEGYSLSAERLAPGDVLILTLHWRATSPVDERYTVFTHLLHPAGHVHAQMDSEPQGGSLPTTAWPSGTPIRDNYALALPADSPPGAYTLQIGMYQPASGARLPLTDAATGDPLGDHLVLQTVDIAP